MPVPESTPAGYRRIVALELVAEGWLQKDVAAHVGRSKATVSRWVQVAKDPEYQSRENVRKRVSDQRLAGWCPLCGRPLSDRRAKSCTRCSQQIQTLAAWQRRAALMRAFREREGRWPRSNETTPEVVGFWGTSVYAGPNGMKWKQFIKELEEGRW